MATYDASLQSPDAKDWEGVMKAYATDQALTKWRSAWQEYVKYGVMQKGVSSAVGKVTAVGTSGVSVRACMDISRESVVDKVGHTVPLPSNAAIKGFAWLLTIQQTNGQLRVTNLTTQTPSGMTFKC